MQDQYIWNNKGNLWQLKKAIKRQSQQPCTIFLFEHKTIQKLIPFSQKDYMKRDIQFMDDNYSREVQLMTRLRHPSILQIQETLVDLKVGKAFCAEPIQHSLLQLIKNTNSINPDALDEIEVQSGLMQVCKGLEFLHKNQIVIVGIPPDSIFIDQKVFITDVGRLEDWRISFCSETTRTFRN
jgi:SCY1-like protein 2